MTGISEKNFNTVMRVATDKCLDDIVKYYDSIEDSDLELSDTTAKRIKRVIRLDATKETRQKWLTALRRVAVAMLIVCTVSFATAMSISAVRAEFWNAIVTWYENYIGIYFESDDDEVMANTSATIETVMKPTSLPDGWTIEEKVINQTLVMYKIIDSQKNSFIFQQCPYSEVEIWTDNEECIVDEIDIDGSTAYLCRYTNGQFCLTWYDEYKFVLSGYNIDREVLVNLATSVK